MKMFLNRLVSPRRLGVTIGVLALCLVLWFFGEFLLGPPLAPWWIRLCAVVGVVALWLLYEFVMFMRIRRANARMLEAIKQEETAVPDVADENERDDMRAQLDRLVEVLKSERVGQGFKRDFLGAMPCYLVVGPPASGKRCLVESAGLAMALRDRLGESEIRLDVRGERTQWWITDDGLLISAAPKDMAAPADATGATPWRGLLTFLKEHRPRRPLDGTLFVVGADELLGPGAADLARFARSRRQEALAVFGASSPLYLVVSKCDLLPGFAEFFADLDEQARSNAFGAVLPLAIAGRPPDEIIAALRRELDRSIDAATRLLPFRVAAERNPLRRAAITELPEQLAAAADAALAIAAELTYRRRSDPPSMLRGIFFTSAGVSGDAPAPVLDGWHERFAAPLGLIAPSPEAPGHVRGTSTSPPLFAAGLFRDFVFPEAGLGGVDPKIERRMAVLHLGGYLACALALVGSVLLWLHEYRQHQMRLDVFARGAAAETTLDRDLASTASIGAVLPLLDQAYKSASARRDDTLLERSVGFTPLDIHVALRAAVQSYHRLLTARLLPLMFGQLQTQLQQAVAAGYDPNQIRSLLTVYLMFGEPAHYARATVSTWGSNLLASVFALNPDQQASALTHWQQLVRLLPQPVSLNQPLIAEARSLLQRHPTADAIYAELQAEAGQTGAAMPLNVVSALGAASSDLLMLRSQAGLSVIVPGLYTRQGFYEIFLKRAPVLVRNAVEGDWISGSGTTADPQQTASLLQQVKDDYTRDYIKQWQSVVGQIELRALPDLPSLVAGMQVLAGPKSPLMQLIQLVKNQTDLPVPPPPASPVAALANAVKPGSGGTKVVEAAAQQAGLTKPVNPFGSAGWPGDAIRAPFASLLALVDANGGEPPAFGLQNAITASYGVVSGIATADSPDAAAATAAAQVISGQGGDPLIQLRVQAATLPRPLDGIFRSLYQNIWAVLLQLTRAHIQTAWSQNVAPVCEETIAGRFPFIAGGGGTSQLGVTLKDFSNFFGNRGVIDQFVSTNLAPFVKQQPGRNLSLASQGGFSLGLSADGLSQINLARRIQALFFDAGGNLAVSFTLTPSYLDPRAYSATIAINQTSLVYQHQPPRSTAFTWPNPNAPGNASLTLSLVDGQTLETSFSGPWSLFQLFDSAQKEQTGSADRITLAFSIHGYRATFVLSAGSVLNPFARGTFAEFHCVPRL